MQPGPYGTPAHAPYGAAPAGPGYQYGAPPAPQQQPQAQQQQAPPQQQQGRKRALICACNYAYAAFMQLLVGGCNVF